LRLRTTGLSFEAIGDYLGVSKQRAHRLVQEVIKEIPTDTIKELFVLTCARLDACIAEAYEGMTRHTPLRDKQGNVVLDDEGNVILVPPDPRAHIAYLALFERVILDRAKFAGAGAAERANVEHSGVVGPFMVPADSEEDFARKVAAISMPKEQRSRPREETTADRFS